MKRVLLYDATYNTEYDVEELYQKLSEMVEGNRLLVSMQETVPELDLTRVAGIVEEVELVKSPYPTNELGFNADSIWANISFIGTAMGSIHKELADHVDLKYSVVATGLKQTGFGRFSNRSNHTFDLKVHYIAVTLQDATVG